MNLFLRKNATPAFPSLPAIVVHNSRNAALTVLLFAAGLFATNTASAFEELNEPQKLIYDTSHLEKTKAGSSIAYDYSYLNNTDDEKVDDKVILLINQERDDAYRDVSIEFLTEERKLHLPDFKNQRGNPVIIGMLEHLAQSLGQQTGGGALYFRNRIKDKLADENLKIKKTDKQSEFSIEPFKNDPYVADRIAITESVITIAFSNDVPGHLLSIEYVSGPTSNPETTRKLVFSGLEP